MDVQFITSVAVITPIPSVSRLGISYAPRCMSSEKDDHEN